MPFIIHEYPIPPVTGVARSPQVTLQLPTGTAVLGILAIPGDAARLIVRGDLAQPLVTRTFVVVRSDVALTTAEANGRYVGSFVGYQAAAGRDVYHALELL